ncbi:MAG TPA: GIY-YIG nuclease family protein [Chitinophagaceae bacterium]|nr:GIY-YIG nuclease family protein [Chitinophagaceae bacterium]
MSLTKQYLTLEEVVASIAPELPGVYVLYNEQGTPIYFGSAENLRAAILDHKRGKKGICTWFAWYFSFELADEPARRERELLEQYQHQYSRLPQCNEMQS